MGQGYRAGAQLSGRPQFAQLAGRVCDRPPDIFEAQVKLLRLFYSEKLGVFLYVLCSAQRPLDKGVAGYGAADLAHQFRPANGRGVRAQSQGAAEL